MAADGFYCVLVDDKHFARGKKHGPGPAVPPVSFLLS